LAYAAVSVFLFEVVFAFSFFGRTRYAVGLSAPICFASLRKFRFNPLRLADCRLFLLIRACLRVQQFYFYNFVTNPVRQQVKIFLTKIEKPLRGFFPHGF
jgi:hypothetical protein